MNKGILSSQRGQLPLAKKSENLHSVSSMRDSMMFSLGIIVIIFNADYFTTWCVIYMPILIPTYIKIDKH